MNWSQLSVETEPRDDHGKWTTGGAAQEPKPSAKAALAKMHTKTNDARQQRYCEEANEPALARAIGGVSLRDNEPIDVIVTDAGVVRGGVELKTMIANTNDKITMSSSAIDRKVAWVRENRADFHTVVFDDREVFDADGTDQHDASKRRIYYRRGFGSFRVGSMHEVGSMRELKQLMATPSRDLPPAARPTGRYPRFRPRKKSLHEYGYVAIQFVDPRVEALAARIRASDVVESVEVGDRHLTLLYGLPPRVTTADVERVLEGCQKPNIIFGKTGHFDGDESDPVYVSVRLTPVLADIRRRLETLPHIRTQAEYTPHVTLARVTRGRGARYDGMTDVEGHSLLGFIATYSAADEVESHIQLSLEDEPRDDHGRWTSGGADHVGELARPKPVDPTEYEDALKKWSSSVSLEERQAITDWRGTSHYVRMFEAAPEQVATYSAQTQESMRRVTTDLRSALARAPEYVGTTYRGMKELPDEVAARYTSVGSVLTLGATSSFTRGEHVANAFGSQYLLVVHGPSGGASIEQLGSRGEQEVVVPKGASFRITSVTGRSRKIIHLEKVETTKTLARLRGASTTAKDADRFVESDPELYMPAMRPVKSADQPRDDHGRWTSGGAGSGVAHGQIVTSQGHRVTVKLVDADTPEEFAGRVKYLLGRDVPITQIVEAAGTVDGATVKLTPGAARSIHVEVMAPGIRASRWLNDERDVGLVMQNDALEFDETNRGRGTAFFAGQVNACRAIGVTKITCAAVRDESTNGYYTWPRLGYDGKVRDSVAGREDNPVKSARVSDYMRTPEGRAFWLEHGHDLRAEFDLADGSQSMRVFSEYAAAKGLTVRAFASTGTGPERLQSGHSGDVDDVRRTPRFEPSSTPAGSSTSLQGDEPRDDHGRWTTEGGETHAEHARRLADAFVSAKQRAASLKQRIASSASDEERTALQVEYDALSARGRDLLRASAAAERSAAAEGRAPLCDEDHVGPLARPRVVDAVGRDAALASWASGLTASEQTALGHWTRKSSDIRRLEVDQTDSGTQTSVDAAALRSAISRAPEYEGTVYRGLGEMPSALIGKYLTPGSIVAHEGTGSFSTSSAVALGFGSKYLLVVSGRTGGVDIGSTGVGRPTEHEVIVPKGIKYRVTRVEDIVAPSTLLGDTMTKYIRLECVVDDGGGSAQTKGTPDQPRDDRGRWTVGGVSGVSTIDKLEGESHSEHAARLAKGIVATKRRMGQLYRAGEREGEEYVALLKHRSELVHAAANAERAAAGQPTVVKPPTPPTAVAVPTSDHVGPLVAPQPADAAVHDAALREWSRGLSKSEVTAFAQWTSAAWTDVRRWEATGTQPPEDPHSDWNETVREVATTLRGAIARAPEYVGAAYRGIGELPDDVAKQYTTPGNVLTLEASSSFSRSPDIAKGFGGKYLISLTGRTGGVDIGTAERGLESEKEVLVPKGVRYRVLRVEHDVPTFGSSKRTVIHMERA